MSKKMQAQAKSGKDMSDDEEPDMPNFTPEIAMLKEKELGAKPADEDMELDEDVDDQGNIDLNDDMPS